MSVLLQLQFEDTAIYGARVRDNTEVLRLCLLVVLLLPAHCKLRRISADTFSFTYPLSTSACIKHMACLFTSEAREQARNVLVAPPVRRLRKLWIGLAHPGDMKSLRFRRLIYRSVTMEFCSIVSTRSKRSAGQSL